MTNNQKTLRLIYPQWQGGVITSWFPNLRAEDASKGYYLGARLLNFLSPNNNQETVEVPISLNYDEESSNECVSRKNAILNQTKAALEILTHIAANLTKNRAVQVFAPLPVPICVLQIFSF